ncbi:GHKL domain-containing protein [Bifidobacterium eulemuris]|uniref:GHKL domain-containing protein n=1 Tax=Bifidobacterium eulemuris TaxID=1765219 RepID=A0A261G7W9_9BIFI|nr:GHKL domain-containing protein [Bifidobacterium eulemuris]OZG67529.1 GHKL domain-containing protein [Bifidobacterium eulemuris]QOL31066.1 sensor histidine kinase [Bifidobacterium eulemuris]
MQLLFFMPFLVEFVVGVLLFATRLDWHRPVRAAAGACVMVAFSVAAAGTRMIWPSVWTEPWGNGTFIPVIRFLSSVTFFACCAALLVILLRWICSVSWMESLVIVAVGYCAQHIAFACVALLRSIAGSQLYVYDMRLLPLHLVVFAVVYWLIWLLVARDFAVDEEKIRDTKARVLMSLGVLALVIVFNQAVEELVDGEWMGFVPQIICYIYDLVCSVLAFALLLAVSNNDRLANDLAVIQQINRLKEQQYEMSRENIELVNTKFHDVRKDLASLRKTAQELQRAQESQPGDSPVPSIPTEALERMERSIRVYDSIFHTGNDALDTLLTEKSLYCAQHGITLTAMADGKQLGFMDRSDVYALFGNILDNAIEAVTLLPDATDRQITFDLRANGRMLRISEENYYTGEVRMADGLPQTSKGDKRFHGFGMRSIARQVAKYQGQLDIATADHVFSLNILIPIPTLL